MSHNEHCSKTEMGGRSTQIIIGFVLIALSLFIGNAQAWTDETPPLDNETLNVGFNPALNESTANNPYPFGLNEQIMTEPLLMSSYLSNDPITQCTTYTLYKQVWDGSAYQQIDNCNISIDTCVDLVYDPVADAYVLPPNWAQVTSNGFLVSRYFQNLINSDSEFCSQWNSSDDTPFPDVFYTYIDVDVEDGEEHVAYMYTSLDDADIESMSVDDTDYGFDLEGRGSDGGSGSIYEGIDMYGGTGDESGMGVGFGWIFFGLIPVIFMLAVLKFCKFIL